MDVGVELMDLDRELYYLRRIEELLKKNKMLEDELKKSGKQKNFVRYF